MAFTDPLQYLGAATALFLTLKVVHFATPYLTPSKLHRYQHDGNSWALVTGSTSGIGEGFAHALANKRFNLLLHGRNQNKLDKLVKELNQQYPDVQVKTVIADVSDIDVDITAIVSAASSLPGKLTILINNVGGAPLSPSYGTLTEVDANYVDKMINLNSRFPTQLTREILPLLTNNSPALIMSTCSVTGYRGLPYLAVYSATKAFNYTFNEAMATELLAESKKIEMLGIVVASVVSAGNKTTEGVFTCNARKMAEEALGRVGCGRAQVIGWWRHAVQWWMMSLLPTWALEKALIGAMTDRRVQEQKGE